MSTAQQFFEQLNTRYLELHQTKENLFWATYMATSTDQEGFARAEQAFKAFISDPQNLAEVKRHLAAADDSAVIHGLSGWQRFFECNVMESAAAQTLMATLITQEATLFAARRDFVMQHINEAGLREEASLPMLSANMAANPDPVARKSSHDALLALEHWVLENGLLEIIGTRNRMAREQGYDNYFDYKVDKHEAMSSDALFVILDEFERQTKDANARALADLRTAKGADATLPWNLRFHMNGDVMRQCDPYLPFAKAVPRWLESFGRLGIRFRGAHLQLDLLERKGKYQNGFCHGPLPAYFDARGAWIAARINFTADAKPNQVGSGERAINTLFHEGGHAAHFANVIQNAPCFSQEFAPTSMAYAETQSMFCDSLLDDADWLKRYAQDASGKPMPDELIRARLALRQPFMAWDQRAILVMPYFERDLYRMAEAERTPAAVLALARHWENSIQGVACAPRPLLAIPHLLNQESAAAYHGYLLANMAVFQTRAYFVQRFGYLTDNPQIGPLLAEHYWAPGNSRSHDKTLKSLTGEGFAPHYLAAICNRSPDEAWAEAQHQMHAAAQRTPVPVQPLDAHIRLIHGTELIADNSVSDTDMCEKFAHWIDGQFPPATSQVVDGLR